MRKLLSVISVLALFGYGENSYSQKQSITIYQANKVLTVDRTMTESEAIAVNNHGRIISVDTFNNLKDRFYNAEINYKFRDKVIVPGLIDPHVHMTLGAMMYGLDFIPPWEMETPYGKIKGLSNKYDLIERITELEKNSQDGPLILYGYHDLVQGELSREDLDKISQTRPIFIWHYSGHDFYLNSAAIKKSNLSKKLANKYDGIGLNENGELNGRIYEDAALALFETLAPELMSLPHIKKGWEGYESLLSRSGVTSVAEMGYGIFGTQTEDFFTNSFYTKEDHYRLFQVPEHRAFDKEFGDNKIKKIIELSKDKHRSARVLKQVKLFTDAAFYSQTMKMSEPGYIGGQSRGKTGLLVTEPNELANTIKDYWDEGIDIHIHSNGDAAQDVTLDAFEKQKVGSKGQRFIIEHGGLFLPEQISKAAKLGAGLSVASHYVKYMGDDYKNAIGKKTQYITPLASAFKAGIHTTLHSDAPLAPPQPLVAASVHMTRRTRQGNISTPSERITPVQALKAITIEAAWSLGLDKEIGSIEAGKRADFTILDENPLTTKAEEWPNIKIHGTFVNGIFKKINIK